MNFTQYYLLLKNSLIILNQIPIPKSFGLCAVSYLKQVCEVQTFFIKIKELEDLYDIDIVPCWTTHSDLNLASADLGSKLGNNIEEYGLAHHNLVDIQNYFNIEIQLDAFATFKSKRSAFYFSPIPQYNCEGIDFFCQKLDCNIV